MIANGQCFSHGQLYVAFSRVRKECDIKVFTRQQQMARNIVMPQILDKDEIEEAEKLYEEEFREEDISNDIAQSPLQSPANITSISASSTPALIVTPTFTTPKISRKILSTPQSQAASQSSAQSCTSSVSSTSQTPRGRGGKCHWGDFKPEQERTRGNLKRKNVIGDGNCLFRSKFNEHIFLIIQFL